jgi:hypothetical protein
MVNGLFKIRKSSQVHNNDQILLIYSSSMNKLVYVFVKNEFVIGQVMLTFLYQKDCRSYGEQASRIYRGKQFDSDFDSIKTYIAQLFTILPFSVPSVLCKPFDLATVTFELNRYCYVRKGWFQLVLSWGWVSR